MGSAVLVATIVFAIAYAFQWPSFSSHTSVASRLKLAALAALAPTAVLFLCIARLAKHRFFTPQDIHGSALTEGTERARLLQAFLQNTLEQTVLAVPCIWLPRCFFRLDYFPWLPPLPPSLSSVVSSSFEAMLVAHLLAPWDSA